MRPIKQIQRIGFTQGPQPQYHGRANLECILVTDFCNTQLACRDVELSLYGGRYSTGSRCNELNNASPLSSDRRS